MPALDQPTGSAGLGRAIVAPFIPTNPFGSSFNMMTIHDPIPQNSYGFASYTDGSSTALVPAYGTSYIHSRSLPRMMQPFSHSPREAPFNSTRQQGFIESIPPSPPIKHESQWTTPTDSKSSPAEKLTTPPSNNTTNTPSTGSEETHIGNTAIDRLMKIIQDKTQSSQSSSPSAPGSIPVVGTLHIFISRQDSMHRISDADEEENKQMLTYGELQDESRRRKNVQKKYRCTFAGCPSSFPQKTHLDIHLRKHTGDKPFLCRYQTCGRSFSQQGNLKTHMDRHSGERRFACEVCGKRFGQRSNLSAHRIVHTGAKPYPCKLDGCDKHFTQLGNLKSHHNKFHQQTIENLRAKLQSGEIDIEGNKEFWSYFFTLYKNANKGIKGRGKDRNISPRSRSLRASHASTGSNASRYISSASAMRSCQGLMGAGGAPSSFGSEVSMYDSDASSMRSRASGSISGESTFSSSSSDGSTDGASSTYSSFTEEMAGDYKRGEGVRASLALGDRFY
ncbi:hypothetical protein DSL72_003850 [Monilinia vaccinii-corymbosi]|uniref:C2H2-type domain-containing protein n=1 Tax=Monilinia vaccinii-corymbosi TaxID=61207 RepID=A0A8A3P2E0_9HELO|nr:hypothetical protein DSL72_003850 [Monilinia vaccinii-corymbosi]